MRDLKVPEITNTAQELITEDPLQTLNNCLAYFQLPTYNEAFTINQKVDFLSFLLQNDEIKEKLEDDINQLSEAFVKYQQHVSLENEADMLEIKIERLKYKYKNVTDKNLDLEKLKCENSQLQSKLNSCVGTEIAELQNIINNVESIDDFRKIDMMACLLKDENVEKRMAEITAKKSIREMPRNTITVFCENLLNYKKISLNKYAESMAVEKIELQKIVFKLVFDGIAEYDGCDIVKLKAEI